MDSAAVHSPYTLDFAASFFAAQTGAGLMIAALVLFWNAGGWAARTIALLGIWAAVVANALVPFERSLGYRPGPDTLAYTLAFAAACGTVTALLARRGGIAAVGVVGQILLWLVSGYVKDSDLDLAALHLGWLALLVGLLLRAERGTGGPRVDEEAGGPRVDEEEEGSYRRHDWTLFAAATCSATLVCWIIMRKREGTGDEWAYTFQAAVFAKGHAYATVPRCQAYLRNFWVFEEAGRLFAQYTPGWPLFMVPFIWLGAPWLSGPFALGLLAVGVARLARSAARGLDRTAERSSAWIIAASGTSAALLVMTGVMITINAASRYSHVYAMALYVWALEALMTLSSRARPPPHPDRWGAVLGGASALLLATRPAEGATMGIGIALLFALRLLRRRIPLRAVIALAIAFATIALFTLVVLRLQLGRWFTTGYALNARIYPWNVTKYDMPAPAEWKYGFPLAMSSYCWWPCALPLGLAGLALLPRRSSDLVAAFGVGAFFYLLYFEWLDSGTRGIGVDWGYGPRYLMMLIVPIAVGCGVAIALLAAAARRRDLAGASAIERGGPMALVLFAILSTWVRVVPLVWPTVTEHTRLHTGISSAIAAMHLKDAVVIAKPGTAGVDPLDVPTNFPLDLYPAQDVIIAVERSPDAADCLRSEFPGRALFSASGIDPVRITPY